MDLTALQYYITVYECRNMSEAARRLSITRQAVSKSMASLEKSLDVKLMTSSVNGLSFTEEGECLYKHACHIESQMGDLRAELTSISTKHDRKLSIACGKASYTIAREPIQRFASRYEKNHITAAFISQAELYDGLMQGTYDVGITMEPSQSEALEETPLLEQPLVLLMDKNHPLAAEKCIPLSALAGYCLVLSREAPRYFKEFSAYLNQYHPEIDCQMTRHSNLLLMLPTLYGSLSIIGVPAFLMTHIDLNRRLASGTLLYERETPRRIIRAVYRKNTKQKELIEQLIDALRRDMTLPSSRFPEYDMAFGPDETP